MKIFTNQRSFNADTYTPVQLYLQLRHQYRNCCLLESNDYHSRQDSRSYIAFDPIVTLQLQDGVFSLQEGSQLRTIPVDATMTLQSQLSDLISNFTFEVETHNGFFGRLGFEFSTPDETHIPLDQLTEDLPLVHFFAFRYVLVIDHFTNEGLLLENSLTGDFEHVRISDFLNLQATPPLPFELFGKERASLTDDAFEDLVKQGVEHCKRGDVFQLVLSNAFEQSFFGDDFHVYRQLRRLNPSPYLFYFDFETYRLFGSSPEAQLVVQDGKAEIHPIAGTVPKTGIDHVDAQQLDFLIDDEKENAEHTMLVDLARNDLSRDCAHVTVERYKEVQHFSHVIHLVSKVVGDLTTSDSVAALCHSFPAGTLSGTPKPKALELIHRYESTPRSFYGGAIGMLRPKGDVNMAIVIRSILSRENTLHYRAGAGVVLDSIPMREVQEVHHKLRAVRQAISKSHAAQLELNTSTL